MGKTRFLPPGATPVAIPTKTSLMWTDLLRQAIERAETTGDKRVQGLRRAMIEGRAEAFLRRLSILSTADLDREMPLVTPSPT
jgi:hypothetical protein